MIGDRLWRVTSPYFCAGVEETQDGVISDAAPILHYACGKNMAWLRIYGAAKGWTFEVVS